MSSKGHGLQATRDVILAAALSCFEREGFDTLGIRAIAKEAGVSPALVIRYFGTKTELFRCVIVAAFSDFDTSRPFSSADVSELVDYLMGAGKGGRAARILVRSAASEDAAEVLRTFVRSHFLEPAIAADAGQDASLRFGMLVALLTGFGVVRDVLQLEELKDAGPDETRTLFARLILACMTP